MFSSCIERQRRILSLFVECVSPESKYQKIIEFGRKLPRLNPEQKIPQNIVSGCQSMMYMHSYMEGEKLYFSIDSEALISAGLAALLIEVYNGESFETIIKCPPDYLKELGITSSLTPSRVNGLYSVYLRMKQDGLRLYVANKKNA